MTLFKRMTAGRVVRTRQIRKREYRELLIEVEADLDKALKGLHDRRTKAQRLVDQMAICDVVGASEKDNYAVVRVPLDLWNEVHDVMVDR